MASDGPLLTLRKVLRHAYKFSWKHSLYLPYSLSWQLDTPSLIVDNNLMDGDAKNPSADGMQFERALSVQQVQDILDNALAQRPDANDQDMLSAFLYYYDNDAFIEFAAESR